jgi:hypothetical protein
MSKPIPKRKPCPSEIKNRHDVKSLVTVRAKGDGGRREPSSWMQPVRCTTNNLKPASAWTEGPEDDAAVAAILSGGPPPPKKYLMEQ